jgi:predicted DNA-binding transcriptional regulator YafY
MLTVLQRRRSWTGAELAQELDVTTRTVRNDVERLRELGYPIHASPGVAGGYRLGAGADLPPLLLNDEEAVAVAIGLASAATGAITGIEESSLRALAKLEQVMPARVRERFQAVQQSVASMPRSTAAIDARTLTTIAAASTSGYASTIAVTRARQACATPNRTEWCTTAAVGICRPGIAIAVTGAPSASIASRSGCRWDRGSCPGHRRMET